MSHAGPTPKAFSISNLLERRLFILLAFAAILLILNILNGNFGELGEDSDDLIRFAQIRDYLAGQSWFDTDQYRMGLTAAGTDMHWSRLPDIPIILLTHLFDIFTSQDRALDLAVAIWPPLSGLILFAAMLIGSDQLRFEGDRKYLVVFTILLTAFFIVTNFRFESGAIDHHNLQFGFIALSMVWAMDREMRSSRFFLSGLTAAICLGIGPEVYIFVAAICGFVALNWGIRGTSSRESTQGFGLGLALGVVAIFFLTVPPSNYGVIYCDALSLITLTASICGGLGLALAAKISGYYGGATSWVRRFMALAALGVICIIVLSSQAPQCLANPLDSLPADVTNLWLGYVEEAMPLYFLTSGWQAFVPSVLGPAAVAVGILTYDYYKRITQGGITSQIWGPNALVSILFLAALALTIYQVRFAPFIYIFALLIFARWIAQIYQTGLEKGGSNIKYILCLALSAPVIWAIPGAPFASPAAADISTQTASEGVRSKPTNCSSADVIEALNQVPKGTIATSANMTGPILLYTDHNAISGNYHRNWEGISTEITLSISKPDASRDLLMKHQIDYFFYCKPFDVDLYANHNPDGLMAKLANGNVPDFLRPISDPSLENGQAILFEVLEKP